jgi:hypothetical protein
MFKKINRKERQVENTQRKAKKNGTIGTLGTDINY